ncbi:MAG: cation:proton antiporter [Dokdonella sp.]|uniref:cation:proton antiporter n=1 Tax=Dokdonella sp. TaxID=2291710 RepID=UPI0025C24D5F|nr:cation:proton antiporter [Dokdonella sp.]MBX3699625.1 cation:proton antiporter [Dokdonella sp.]
MHHAADILLALFVIFVAAQVGAELAQRLRLPGVVGEILAGCAIGPSALGWIRFDELAAGTPLDLLAELGVVFLLFAVGLETRLDDLKKVGRSALLVGVLGVLLPFVCGALWAHGSGLDWVKSMFVAAAFVATSAGITARVLQELGVLDRIESRVILGAAVIDDILAMLLLGMVTSLQEDGGIDLAGLGLVLVQALGFVAIIGWVGTRVMRKRGDWLDRPINPLSPLTIALAICLGLAWLSTGFGLAAIIGAFLAGMIASEIPRRDELEHQMQPLLALLTPFFFVLTGAKIDLAVFASGSALWMLTIASLIAIATKFVGGALGALALGRRGAAIVGVGMVPRGEVGVVIASLGLAAGVFSGELYAVIVAMSLLTAIVTPPLLALLLRGHRAGATD